MLSARAVAMSDIAQTGRLHRQTSTVARDLANRRRTGAVVVNAAFRFDFTISHDTGMYFVAPLVVPEESA